MCAGIATSEAVATRDVTNEDVMIVATGADRGSAAGVVLVNEIVITIRERASTAGSQAT